MKSFEDEMKRVFLAGVGAIATTAEKAQDLVEKLVSKGEITVEQGKVLNEELKRDFKGATAKVAQKGEELIDKVETMSTKELEKLKKKIESIQNDKENN